VFGLILYVGVPNILDESANLAIVAVFIPFLLFLLGTGTWLLWAHISNYTVRLVITDWGVTYGRNNWEWKKIKSMHPRYLSNEKLILYIQLKGVFGVERVLTTDNLISPSAYRTMSDALRNAIKHKYHDVVIW
jgi:hypothetical protein